MHIIKRCLSFFLIAVSFCSCDKEITEISASKDIISFQVNTVDGSLTTSTAIQVKFLNDTIYVSVPYGTELNPLIPSIRINGISVSPESDVAQDFSKPVQYTVTAEDKSTRTFTVMVTTGEFHALYFGCYDKHFYALDPITGTLLWKYRGDGGFNYSDPEFSNGVVFAGGSIDDGTLYAFDAVKGAPKWTFKINNYGIESPPAVNNNTVYIGGIIDFHVYALDEQTGQVKWKFPTHQNNSTKPVFYENKVIFGSSDGNLYAVDTASGELQWVYTMSNMVNQSSPVILNGVVFIGNRDGYLYAVNASTGELKWKYDAGFSLEMSTPAAANGIIYIGGWYVVPDSSPGGPMYAVDENTGELKWKTAGIGFSSSPCVANGIVYITGDDGNIHAYDAYNGFERWSHLIYANSASPTVDGDMVYVGGGGTEHFYAFDAMSGVIRWMFPIPGGYGTSKALIVHAGAK